MSLFLISLSTLFCLAVNDYQHQPNPTPTDAALSQLAPACWHNWQAHDARFADPGYTPSVWRPTDSNVSATGRKAAAYPGRTWLLWNEPESHNQANTLPDVAAGLTIQHMAAIGDNGRVACCGVMLGAGGIGWLDDYLAAGGPVPDVWHVHAYGLTVDAWRNAMAYWWWWHAQHGDGRPTIISETSLIHANATEQAKLLQYLRGYDDSRVEAVYWFSAFPERSALSWAGSALMDASYTKTALGEQYAPTAGSNATVITLPDGSSYAITATQLDAVTWAYHIEKLSGKDLSHWVLSLSTCVNHVVSTEPVSAYGIDPTTGALGWKFEPITNQSATYTIMLDGEYPASDLADVTMKAGAVGNHLSAVITGPDCTQVDPPTVTPTITPTPTATPASTATGTATPTATMAPEAAETPAAPATATEATTSTPEATKTATMASTPTTAPTELFVTPASTTAPVSTPTAPVESPTATITPTATTVIGGVATIEPTPTATATELPTNLDDGAEPLQYRAWMPIAPK